jgi:hypothetical protein
MASILQQGLHAIRLEPGIDEAVKAATESFSLSCFGKSSRSGSGCQIIQTTALIG